MELYKNVAIYDNFDDTMDILLTVVVGRNVEYIIILNYMYVLTI